MKAKKNARQRNPAIKGYLPVRIALPSASVGSRDKDEHRPSYTSFIYIKEHAHKSGSATPGGGATLFVANAPANGPIRTDLFLRAVFEPYGDVQRVTVAKDPRRVGGGSSSGGGEVVAVEAFREAALAGMNGFANAADPALDRKGDGKFAHVVFTSGKEMKKALKALRREISESDGPFVLELEEDAIERLEAETARLSSYVVNNDSDDDDGDDDDEPRDRDGAEVEGDIEAPTGIRAVAARARRRAGRHIPREKLMQMCNEAMASFETEEAEAGRRARLAAEHPDDDGFITVTHNNGPSFGAADGLEADGQHSRRRGGKRSRKRKAGGSGADELPDFYRFQMKEKRKGEMQDLKKRFEEDLAKVKKMKEARAYRPF